MNRMPTRHGSRPCHPLISDAQMRRAACGARWRQTIAGADAPDVPAASSPNAILSVQQEPPGPFYCCADRQLNESTGCLPLYVGKARASERIGDLCLGLAAAFQT